MSRTLGARITEFSRGQEIQRRLHELVPGGSHTYSKGEDQFPWDSPQIIARADGAYCWDVDGNRYLDWAMGNRVFVLGHNHPVVNEAVKRQIDLGLNFTRPGLLEYETAEFLVDFFPGVEMVKFGKNGSDVTSAAMRLARAHTGRKLVAYCGDHPFFSFHDWFIGTKSMPAGVPKEISDLTVTFPYNDLEGVEELVSRHPGEIAAFILEPVKNDEPHPGYLEGLREITAREGIVLVFDEMISGLRFDLRGAHHRYGVYPDLVTYGKAIANGYSFSMLGGKREIMELGGLKHDRERVFLLSQTHSSETLGLAACVATLQECERVDVTSHIWATGGSLVRGIRSLAEQHELADYVRVIGFDCNPQLLCTRADGTYWPELHTSFHEEVIARGVLLPWTTVTYAHGETQVEETMIAIDAGLEKVKRALETNSVESSFVGPPIKPVFRPYNRCLQDRCGRVDPSAPKLACCQPDEPGRV